MLHKVERDIVLSTDDVTARVSLIRYRFRINCMIGISQLMTGYLVLASCLSQMSYYIKRYISIIANELIFILFAHYSLI